MREMEPELCLSQRCIVPTEGDVATDVFQEASLRNRNRIRCEVYRDEMCGEISWTKLDGLFGLLPARETVTLPFLMPGNHRVIVREAEVVRIRLEAATRAERDRHERTEILVGRALRPCQVIGETLEANLDARRDGQPIDAAILAIAQRALLIGFPPPRQPEWLWPPTLASVERRRGRGDRRR